MKPQTPIRLAVPAALGAAALALVACSPAEDAEIDEPTAESMPPAETTTVAPADPTMTPPTPIDPATQPPADSTAPGGNLSPDGMTPTPTAPTTPATAPPSQ